MVWQGVGQGLERTLDDLVIHVTKQQLARHNVDPMQKSTTFPRAETGGMQHGLISEVWKPEPNWRREGLSTSAQLRCLVATVEDEDGEGLMQRARDTYKHIKKMCTYTHVSLVYVYF